MSYFLPRECPKCQMLVSPAKEPLVGDLAVCPLCGVVMTFIAGLLLRLATPTERIHAQEQLAQSEA